MKTAFNGRLGALLAGSALMLMSGVAQSAITNSKHDLTSGSSGGNKLSGTADLCVFCHTPHGASVTASVPLWNRTLSAPAVYTSYSALGTTSLQGKTTAVGSVSIACLSCHDGTAAINTVINTPGSGTVGVIPGTWTGTLLATGKMPVGVTNMGTDLRGDHPIGIQYGGGKSSAYVTGTSVAAGGNYDLDFKGISAVSATVQGWYVDTGTAGKQKTDLLLYTRSDAAIVTPAGAQPFIECGTCHDPHESAAGTFLRTSNAGSGLCLACHTK